MGEKAGFRHVRQPSRGHTAHACLMPTAPDSSVDTPGGLQGQARLPSSIVKEGRREVQLAQPCRHQGCFIDGAPQLSTLGGPCRRVVFVQKMLGGRRLPNHGVPCLWCQPSSVVAPPGPQLPAWTVKAPCLGPGLPWRVSCSIFGTGALFGRVDASLTTAAA